MTDRVIKSFVGVQGAVFQKSPLVAEGSHIDGRQLMEFLLKTLGEIRPAGKPHLEGHLGNGTEITFQ